MLPLPRRRQGIARLSMAAAFVIVAAARALSRCRRDGVKYRKIWIFDNLGRRALSLNDASDLSRCAFVNRSAPADRKRNSLIPPHPFNGEFIKAFVGTGKFEIDDFFRTRKIKKAG
jgi:hypothetical protein